MGDAFTAGIVRVGGLAVAAAIAAIAGFAMRPQPADATFHCDPGSKIERLVASPRTRTDPLGSRSVVGQPAVVDRRSRNAYGSSAEPTSV